MSIYLEPYKEIGYDLDSNTKIVYYKTWEVTDVTEAEIKATSGKLSKERTLARKKSREYKRFGWLDEDWTKG